MSNVNLIIECDNTGCEFCHEGECGKDTLYINDKDCPKLKQDDYVRFCMKCGWNDPDMGCSSPPGEEVYQCPMYMHYHPEDVEKFNRDMEEWAKTNN